MTYTTLWVRPGALDYHYAGPYGNGSGSSYANAIPGLMNVPWTTTPKLQLIVAGTHVKSWAGVGTVVGHASLNVPTGTADYPTIIRGDATRFDAAATPGLICAGMIDQYSPAWEDLSGGLWRRTSTRYGYSYKNWSAYLDGGETHPEHFNRITPVETIEEVTAQEGTSFIQVYGNPHTIYIHLPVGINPQTQYVTDVYGYRFNILSKEHIIFNRLQIMYTEIANPLRLEFRKSSYYFWSTEMFAITGDLPGNIIDRCQISWANAGVYAFSVATTPPQISNNIRVTGTYITDIGSEWHNQQPSDAHAIAARHGVDDYYIDGCKTERTGHAIVVYNYPFTGHCSNVVVKRTICRSPHTWYVYPDWNGIALNPADLFKDDTWLGFDVSGNVVERCYVEATGMNYPIRNGVVVDYDVNDPSKTWRCINNQVDHGRFGICLGNSAALLPERCSTGYIRGNVLRWQDEAFILQSAGSATRKNFARNGGTDSNNNVFVAGNDPPLADVFFAPSGMTLAQWRAESPRFDPNSVRI